MAAVKDLPLLGFLIFPLFWSIPEALVTAELATSFPENGGYVIWISSVFGPFWGFQEGFWKWFSGVMDNALYPVLFLDYLKHSFPIFDELYARIPALLGITILLTYLNYKGLHIVGTSAVVLAGFSLAPFAVMSILSVFRGYAIFVDAALNRDWIFNRDEALITIGSWGKSDSRAILI